VDLDIKSFFDTLDHRLLMKALGKHTKCRWVLLYVERWLKAPVQLEDGTLAGRDKGTPQGSVVSPLLSNLFLHYAFDMWMKRNQPHMPFERYADDIICHCRNQAQAEWVHARVAERLRECKLELHAEKTQIVYCKDDRRRGRYPKVQFEFLGFAFQPRRVKSASTRLFVGYTPAISQGAAKAIRDVIRSWRLDP
jgi:group II intron reverse transcriptase/maturase